MDDLRSLYQEVIIDHSQHPRNFGVCEGANHVGDGHNPVCGDRLTLFLKEKDGKVEDVSFQGEGCAIFLASISLMTEAIKGQSIAAIKKMYNEFHNLVTTGNAADLPAELDKLAVFSGVKEFPLRVKCATLPWHTLKAALTRANLNAKNEPVTTE